MSAQTKNTLFYGWWVVVSCLVIGTIIFGTRYSYGVFFKSIGSEFELTRAVTSAIFSVYMVLGSGFEILGGWALDRYGPRIVIMLMGLLTGIGLVLTGQTSAPWQLFITYSLLLAAGTGAAYSVLMATVIRWFEKKRGLALGIAGAGAGLGVVVMAPFAAYLISRVDWRISYVVIGAVASSCVVSLSRVLRKDPAELGLLPDGARNVDVGKIVQNQSKESRLTGFSLAQAARTRSFWFLGMVWLLWALCLHLVLTHIVPHAMDLGIFGPDAAIILALIGGFSVPGRLIMGAVSDRIGKKLSAVICALAQAGAMIWLIGARDLWMFYAFAVAYGLAYGGIDPPTVALISDAFGLRSLGVIMAALHMGWGIGAAIGPALGGLIFDTTGNYCTAFLIGALAMVLVTPFAVLTRREKDRTT